MDVFNLSAKIGLDTSEYDRGLKDASERTGGFGSKVKSAFGTFAKVGGAALTAATGATVAFGKSAVEAGMSFDATMSQVGAVSGATGAEFDSLRDKAVEMGAKTQFSASESAEAFTYMAMAGWKTGDMLGGIEGIMNLAAASGEDLASTSDIVTDAITAFGLSAGDSGHFADVLAAASSNANTNVGMLGESFKYVAPVAGAMGYSVEDASVALGLMANSGIKASQAGTSLRTAITNMASPTKNMAAVMEEYGISLTDADGTMLSLQAVMGQLREKMGGLDQSTQASAASMLFGKEAMSGMLAIINASDADFNKLTSAIEGCDGAAGDMAKTMNDNLAGDITLFNSAMEGAQIVVSDKLTPSLREFVQFGTKGLGELTTAFQTGGLSGAMEALGGIISDGLNMLIDKLPAMVDAGMKLLGALGQGILDNLPKITSAAAQIIITLLQGLITALPALAQGAVMMISQLATALGQALPYLIPAAIQAVLTFLQGLTSPASLNNLINGALMLIQGLVVGIARSIPLIIKSAGTIIANLITGLIKNGPKIGMVGWQLLGELIKGLVQGLVQLPGALLEIGKALVTGFGELVGSIWDWITGKNKDALTTMTTDVDAASSSMLDSTTQAFGGMEYQMGLSMNNMIATSGRAGEISSTIGGEFDHLGLNTTDALLGMENQMGLSFDNMLTTAGTQAGAIQDAVTGHWDGLYDYTAITWEEINDVAFKHWRNMEEESSQKFEAMADAVVTNWKEADESSKSTWEGIGGLLDGAWAGMQASAEVNFSSIQSNITGAWERANTSTTDNWDEMSDTVLDSLTGMNTETGTATNDIFQMLDSSWQQSNQSTGDNWDEIHKMIEQKSQNALEAVKTEFPKMTGVVMDELNRAKREASGQDWSSIGNGIVDGISAGVRARAALLGNSVANAALGALSAAQSALGINSPSRVFKRVIGFGIDEGIIDGVEEKRGQVLGAVSAMAKGLETEFQPSLEVAQMLELPKYTAPRTVPYTASPKAQGDGRLARQGDTIVNIYSPKAVDGAQAAREWKKTTQQLALGFI